MSKRFSLNRATPLKPRRMFTVAHGESQDDIIKVGQFKKLPKGFRYIPMLVFRWDWTQVTTTPTAIELLAGLIKEIKISIPGTFIMEKSFTGPEFLSAIRQFGWSGYNFQPIFPQQDPPTAGTKTGMMHIPLMWLDPHFSDKCGMYPGMITKTDKIYVRTGTATADVETNATVTGKWDIVAYQFRADRTILHPEVHLEKMDLSGPQDLYDKDFLMRGLSQYSEDGTHADDDKKIYTFDGGVYDVREEDITMKEQSEYLAWWDQQLLDHRTPNATFEIDGVNTRDAKSDLSNIGTNRHFTIINAKNRIGDVRYPRESIDLDIGTTERRFYALKYKRWDKGTINKLSKRLGARITSPVVLMDDGQRPALKLEKDFLPIDAGIKP